MRKSVVLVIAVLMAVFALLPGAAAQDEDNGTFSLQILHSSDNESSFQDPNTLEPKLLNYAAIVDGLRDLAPNGNSLHLTAGDHTLPGPFYEASAEVDALGARGLGDIVFFNAMGLTANGIGNHEFDGGINDFARMLSIAEYPFLAVNLDFSNVELAEGTPAIEIGEDGLSVEELAGKVARSAYVEVGGERIGLIGRAPADFFNVIADPDETIPGLDFYGGRNPEDNQPLESAVDQVLAQVELLEAQGINKIILLDHAQDFTGDPLSANVLRGIDVIVAAGSTGFMARPEANGPFNLLRPGDVSGANYPTVRLDADGNFVVVVNSDQLFTYVGHLIVSFDAEGRIVNIDPNSGPIATTSEAVELLSAEVGRELSAPETLVTIYDELVNTPLITEQFTVVGEAAGGLNGQRADVRGRETNLGRLAADSSLWWAQNTFPELGVDIALKNGGGIRATIQGPNVTVLTIGAALAFNNNMVVVELTAAELIATMENAVSRVPAADGRFPQIAGMVLEYDASREGISDATTLDTPSRVRTLIVTLDDGTEDVVIENFEAQGDLERTFFLVTNNFLLTGGDGYQALAAASEARGFEDPGVGERQILRDYITEELGGVVEVVEPLENPRITRLDEMMEEME